MSRVRKAPSGLIVTFEALQELGGIFVNQGEHIRGWSQFGPCGIAETRKHLSTIIKVAQNALVALDRLEAVIDGWEKAGAE